MSHSAPLAAQLKARFVKFMCKALEHDNPVVKYVAKVSCLNPMSVSGRNWRHCVTIQNEVSMVDINVKNVYKEEWYDSISVNEIDSASVVKEMIDVRDGSVKCELKCHILCVNKEIQTNWFTLSSTCPWNLYINF